jgi:hypothetical protein
MVQQHIHSKHARFFLSNDTSTTLNDISGDTIEISGLPGEVEQADGTVLSDTGRKTISGLENIRFSGRFFRSTGSSGARLLEVAWKSQADRQFKWSEATGAAGYRSWNGVTKVISISNRTTIGEMQIQEVQFQGQGTITLSTSTA